MKKHLSCWLIDRSADLYVLFNPVTPIPTGRLSGRIRAVKTGQVNFFIYSRGGRAICIDAGLGRHVIQRELERLHISPASIDAVFLTHSDFDHAGGIRVFPGSKVYLSRDEKPLADGTRSRRFGILRNRLPRCQLEFLENNAVRRIGEITVRAISTPGHTVGSMSYLVDGKYLFTGDAFRILDGKVRPIHPILTMDREAELRSIRKLARLSGVEAVFTAHRGYSGAFDAVMSDWR